ncbi:trypsin-like peptidase domain-containing protein [Haloimpatiens sp. FM7330]|uniref:trypsin-like peptidase domain-containing protein n=1 Tax=Haloimpatiens sp. FM7330 TaxID=3298610 RepID=UPI0036456A2E
MLDIKKYIGKICLEDESKHLGTGFLIDKNKLITAKHVFINNNISDEDEKNIKIYFKEVEEQVKEVGIIKIIKHENRDIVIIELDEEMDEYFKMDVSDFHSGEKFITFGYSARKKTYGEKIYGQILIEDFKNNEQYDLDLHCPDFPALSTKMFKGISGAPIISDKNYVKGMIIKKPDGTESFAGIKFSKSIDFLKFNNVEVNSLGGDIPKVDDKYINRKKYEKDIIELLSKKKIVQVYGLSGIGKTQLVTQIINSEKNKFEKVYWIDIKDQNDGKIDLKKAIIFGKNKPINLEEIIKRYETLIVIDNLNNNAEDVFESFNNIQGNSSKLMITSLEKVFEEEYTYKIDYLTLEEAYKLFEKEKLGKIKSGVLKSFLNEIDRHPLLLRLIISLLKRDKNLKLEDIQNDYKNIHKIKDKNKNSVFFKRIVGRYIYDYEEILSHITTINNLFIEKSFMKKFGIIELQELISACIVNDNNTYYYYVHKIVLNSLKEILKENKYILEFKEVLKEYLEKKLDIRDIYYFKFL